MAEGDAKGASFTVYLEGHEGHQGNVLAHAFVEKLRRLIITLNKLERAYLGTETRRTDFEIVDADKVNPTLVTLKPVSRAKGYRPTAALDWSLEQFESVASGRKPDARVRSDIASDFVKLATKEADGYKAFWINGQSKAIRFDEKFLANAEVVARERTREDAPLGWHVGVSHGSIVGELKKVDDIEGHAEFVVVPKTGPEQITCKFSEELRPLLGVHLFKVVRVTGKLHYREDSPFPYLVEVESDGLEQYPIRKARRTLLEMRGVFANADRDDPDWNSILNV